MRPWIANFKSLLLLGFLVFTASYSSATTVLRLESIEPPGYPPLLLSARIQFDLEFSAVVRSDGGIGDIKLISAEHFGGAGERLFGEQSSYVDSVVAEAIAHLKKWRVESSRAKSVGSEDHSTGISIHIQYRIIDTLTDECSELRFCISRFHVDSTATSISVAIGAIGPQVMQ